LKFPRKALNQVNCENCQGDNLHNCKDVLGFDSFNSEYSKYIDRCDHPKNTYDVWQSGNAQWCCDCVTSDDSYETCFTIWCWKDKNVFYSDNCHSSGNLFGCVSLRRANYCILNKEYSAEEYEALLARIIEHMQASGEYGEFLQLICRLLSYNETNAQDFSLLTKEEALEQGYRWESDDEKQQKPQTYEIPDDVKDVPESITDELLSCVTCGKNYKIITHEYALLKKIGVPIPRKCFECRHQDRSVFRKKRSCISGRVTNVRVKFKQLILLKIRTKCFAKSVIWGRCIKKFGA